MRPSSRTTRCIPASNNGEGAGARGRLLAARRDPADRAVSRTSRGSPSASAMILEGQEDDVGRVLDGTAKLIASLRATEGRARVGARRPRLGIARRSRARTGTLDRALDVSDDALRDRRVATERARRARRRSSTVSAAARRAHARAPGRHRRAGQALQQDRPAAATRCGRRSRTPSRSCRRSRSSSRAPLPATTCSSTCSCEALPIGTPTSAPRRRERSRDALPGGGAMTAERDATRRPSRACRATGSRGYLALPAQRRPRDRRTCRLPGPVRRS